MNSFLWRFHFHNLSLEITFCIWECHYITPTCLEACYYYCHCHPLLLCFCTSFLTTIFFLTCLCYQFRSMMLLLLYFHRTGPFSSIHNFRVLIFKKYHIIGKLFDNECGFDDLNDSLKLLFSVFKRFYWIRLNANIYYIIFILFLFLLI